jgi:N-acetylneuraminate lyase
MKKKLKGFIAAPLTGFYPDGSINPDIVPTYAQMLYDNGVAAVFVNGTTGEGMHLTIEERLNLATQWVNTAPEELKVIIHVGYSNQEESKALASHAAEICADAVGQIGPLDFKPETIDILVDYAATTAAAAPDLPYYYYHMPSMNDVDFPMIEFLRIADSIIPNLAGIKYTHDDIADFSKCLIFKGGKYEIFFGRDEFLIDGLEEGAEGAVGSTYNIMVSLYHDLVKAFKSGDLKEAVRLQNISAETCRNLYATGGFGAGLKAVMYKIGLNFGQMRHPGVNLTADSVKVLLSSLEKSHTLGYLNRLTTPD